MMRRSPAFGDVPPRPRRIAVVGTSGGGKTTLARALARHLSLPYTELDAIFWKAGWTPETPEVFRAKVDEVTSGPSWVVDGSNGGVHDLTWRRAELVVWLDYSLATHLWRVTARTVRRLLSRETLWSGNRDTFTTAFLRPDQSLLFWIIKTHAWRRRSFELFLERPENVELPVWRVRSSAELRRLKKELALP